MIIVRLIQVSCETEYFTTKHPVTLHVPLQLYITREVLSRELTLRGYIAVFLRGIGSQTKEKPVRTQVEKSQ